MRIYADENVWKPVVTGLRRRGWNVSSVFEEAPPATATVNT